jgi:hypothetical protein
MKDELAQRLVPAKGPRLNAAALKVMLRQRISALDAFEHRNGVSVPMAFGDQALIDARELLRVIVKAGFADLSVGEIDRPTVQGGRPLVGTRAVAIEHLPVSHHVEHDRVALVIGVHRMKHVARFDVEPAKIRAGALCGITPTRAVLGQLLERTSRIEAEDRGQWLPSLLVRRLERLQLICQ